LGYRPYLGSYFQKVINNLFAPPGQFLSMCIYMVVRDGRAILEA